MFLFVATKRRLKVWLSVIAVVLVSAIVLTILFSNISFAKEKKLIPIYSVKTEKADIALTINCAWDNKDIPDILKTLKDNNIKATFFIVGEWCDKYPESVKAIAEAGHDLGTHSDTHPDMAKLSKDDISTQIQKPAEKINAVTGSKPVFFRAPSGSYNNKVIDSCYKLGYIPIQWDVDSIDWRDPTVEEMTSRVSAKTRNGSILLFHSGKKNTPAALPVIIKELKGKGFNFVKLSDLVYSDNYDIDNQGKQFKL